MGLFSLRELLNVGSGGVVFTTIQKFFPDEKGGKHPLLSDRRNIVVIADEAHRSQYDFIDGFARRLRDALPKASFIGLTPSLPGSVGLCPTRCVASVGRPRLPPVTGTPIESGDKNTQAVFGDLASQARHQLVSQIYHSRLSRAVVIDVYDILQSKEDKATVPIYYEARLAKIDLKPEERPMIDPNFEEGASRTGIGKRGGIHEGKSAPEVER